MTALVLRGDARALPLPDASVDLVVTSPPYWALRSYTDGGQHYDGQIGSEATPAEYVAALLDCTAEWVRVLKPSGSLFVNLGDKYSDRGHGPSRGRGTGRGPQAETLTQTRGPMEKSLLGLPWRYALGCIDQLGLILRAELIWSKPNGLPESVTDRVRRSHEQWFHLTRRARYFAAVDEIREAHAPATVSRTQPHRARTSGIRDAYQHMPPQAVERDQMMHPLGKLPGSVWDIPSEPLTVPDHLGVDHFAAFPSEWPKRLILGWSPSGVCTVCGEGRRPVVETTRETYHGAGRWRSGQQQRADGAAVVGFAMDEKWDTRTTIAGYGCACPDAMAPTTPAIVLDPFGGTGTTALAASALGRIGISIDMSADYNRLAQWRTNDPGQRAKVLGVAKPPTQINGQGDLLAELGAVS